MTGNIDFAITQLQTALSRPSTFRQAVSTLQFELAWVLLSRGEYAEASAAFLKMVPLNSWSHSTYYALSAGCLHQLDSRTSEQEKSMRERYIKIPESFNRKRFMGQPPSSEIYLEKRIKFYKQKTERWIISGKLPNGSEWFESVRISIALELSLYWNQFAHYPPASLAHLIDRLTQLLEDTSEPLNTPEEIALCHIILGASYLTLSDFSAAQQHISHAEKHSATLSEAYTYILALSRFYQAILYCREADVDLPKREDKEYWRSRLALAEKKLDEVFAQTGYDMNGRVESRGPFQFSRIFTNLYAFAEPSY